MSERLAIDGGTPVRDKMLPYGRQTVDQSDIDAVIEVLGSDFLTTGPKVREFEEQFADYVGADYAVAVSSGTAALHSAILAAGIGSGDEVITSPMTFVASANAVLYADGDVIFSDVEHDTLNIDPECVSRLVTEQTRVILPVDFGGHPADLKALREIADQHSLLLIEDASHSLGGRYQGDSVGGIADLTTFSLHPVKLMTTGEGGVVTTQSEKLAKKLRRIRNHGIATDFRQRAAESSWYYEMVELGFNFRITDIQCALGLSQLEKLSKWLERRRDIAQQYQEGLSRFDPLSLPSVREGCDSAWHLYVIQVDCDQLTADRGGIFKALRAENIGVNVHYIPVPWHPYYRSLGFDPGSWPVAEAYYERALSLPMWPGMSDGDVQDVIRAVDKVLLAYS